jgi:hypothetical protein
MPQLRGSIDRDDRRHEERAAIIATLPANDKSDCASRLAQQRRAPELAPFLGAIAWWRYMLNAPVQPPLSVAGRPGDEELPAVDAGMVFVPPLDPRIPDRVII